MKRFILPLVCLFTSNLGFSAELDPKIIEWENMDKKEQEQYIVNQAAEVQYRAFVSGIATGLVANYVYDNAAGWGRAAVNYLNSTSGGYRTYHHGRFEP